MSTPCGRVGACCCCAPSPVPRCTWMLRRAGGPATLLTPCNTTPYSLLTTHYSLLTTHHSLLTTHHSLLTTHHSPPTTHDSPLTTHHSRLTTHHPPLTTHHSSLTTHHLQVHLGPARLPLRHRRGLHLPRHHRRLLRAAQRAAGVSRPSPNPNPDPYPSPKPKPNPNPYPNPTLGRPERYTCRAARAQLPARRVGGGRVPRRAALGRATAHRALLRGGGLHPNPNPSPHFDRDPNPNPNPDPITLTRRGACSWRTTCARWLASSR